MRLPWVSGRPNSRRYSRFRYCPTLNVPLRRNELRNRAAPPLLVLALIWLTLPVVGPLDDHHFAERTHTHQHLLLNRAFSEHQHYYDPQGRQRHGTAMAGADSREAGSDGIAFMSSTTANVSLTVLFAPYQDNPQRLRPVSPHCSDRNPLLKSGHRVATLNGIHTPPPIPPPIV